MALVPPATAVVARFQWKFGDGSDVLITTSGQAVHIFVNGAGPYTVSITATATSGQSTQGFTIINP